MQRREFIGLLSGAAAVWPLGAGAQRSGRIAKVGFLFPGSATIVPSRIASLISGLETMGFHAANEVEFILRLTAGDESRLAPMAGELVEQKVDLIVAVSRPAVLATRLATAAIPIVALDLESDPVGSGFAASYSRPGGNLTGFFFDFPDFGMKWLELAKEIIPGLGVVVVLWDPAAGLAHAKAVAAAVKLFGAKQEVLEVRVRGELEEAFAAAGRRRADAVLILSSPIFGSHPEEMGNLTLRHRLPAVTLFPELARAGVLIAYGPSLPDAYRQVGVMVGKVLRGANVAQLPIERPTKFELVVNLKSAKALGLTIPTALLARADEVIE